MGHDNSRRYSVHGNFEAMHRLWSQHNVHLYGAIPSWEHPLVFVIEFVPEGDPLALL